MPCGDRISHVGFTMDVQDKIYHSCRVYQSFFERTWDVHCKRKIAMQWSNWLIKMAPFFLPGMHGNGAAWKKEDKREYLTLPVNRSELTPTT